MASKKDIFAPPSQEELKSVSGSDQGSKDIFAAPSADELAKHPDEAKDIDFANQQPPSLMSDLGDLGSGVVQGATLGGSDEIGGAIDAGLIKLTDAIHGKKGQEFLKLYRENQQKREAANNAAKERSPWLYGSGELGGAVGTGILTAGAGLGAGAAGGAVAEGLTAARLVELGLSGAALGGTQAGLSSKGNLDTEEGRKQLTGDVATGAVIGGALAPVTAVAGEYLGGKLGKKAADVISDDPEVQKIKLAYEAGKKGIPVKGEAGRTYLREDLNQATDDAANKLLSLRKNASKDIGAAVNKLDEVPTGEIISNVEQRSADLLAPDAVPALAHSEEFQGFRNLVNKYKKTLGNKLEEVAGNVLDNAGNPINSTATKAAMQEVSPILSGENLQLFAKDLKQLQKSTKNPNVKDLISQTLTDIQGAFTSSGGEELTGLNNQMKTLAKLGPETFLKKEVMRYPSEAKALDALQLNIKNAVLRSTRAGSTESRETAFETINNLKGNLKSIQDQYPDALKKVGIDDIDGFVNNLMDKGKMSDIYAGITRLEPHTGLESTLTKIPKSPIKLLGFGAESSRGKGYLGAYRAGKIVNTGYKVYNATQNQLLDVADRLNGVGLKSLGEALFRGIQDPSGSLKNAALFTILQNPQAREVLHSTFGDEGGDNE